MANPGYVRSTDGSDADNGSTWALANATLTGAIADAAAGDRIWGSDNHAETTAGAVTLTFPGTLASPNQVLCGDDAAEPPTTLAATASVTSTGTNAIVIRGVAYIYGHIFNSATGTGNQILAIADASGSFIYAETCEFHAIASGAVGGIRFGALSVGGVCAVELVNSVLRFSNVGQALYVCGKGVIRGGSASASGSDPTNFCDPTHSAGEGFDLTVEGFDFSNWGAALNLVKGGAVNQPGRAIFRNCKTPAAWTGLLVSTPFTNAGFRAEAYNVGPGDTNYSLWIDDPAGSIRHDDTLYRAPGLGASSWMYNGSTQILGISWKMSPSANAEYPMIALESGDLSGLNTVVDPTTSHVITGFFTTPGQADFTPLTNKDIGLRVQYPGNAGSPQSKFVADLVANVLATEDDQEADTDGDWDDAATAWAAVTLVSLGDVRRPTTPNGKTYYCSVGGVTGATEPTWGTTEGGETSDGATVKWRCMHRQKCVVTLDASSGKIKERGHVLAKFVMFGGVVAYCDPNASMTSS